MPQLYCLVRGAREDGGAKVKPGDQLITCQNIAALRRGFGWSVVHRRGIPTGCRTRRALVRQGRHQHAFEIHGGLARGLVVIVAGYPAEMQRFLAAKPGLASGLQGELVVADFAEHSIHPFVSLLGRVSRSPSREGDGRSLRDRGDRRASAATSPALLRRVTRRRISPAHRRIT